MSPSVFLRTIEEGNNTYKGQCGRARADRGVPRPPGAAPASGGGTKRPLPRPQTPHGAALPVSMLKPAFLWVPYELVYNLVLKKKTELLTGWGHSLTPHPGVSPPKRHTVPCWERTGRRWVLGPEAEDGHTVRTAGFHLSARGPSVRRPCSERSHSLAFRAHVQTGLSGTPTTISWIPWVPLPLRTTPAQNGLAEPTC